MPSYYKRKSTVERGTWSESSLQNAVQAIRDNRMGLNDAARTFGVPRSTIQRRMKTNNLTKCNRLGPPSCLGEEIELKLVVHIKKLQKYGFAPTRDSVRQMAFQLADRFGIRHKFNKENKKAGYDWLQSFLRRHPDISVRKGEGVSVARAQGLSKEVVKQYFDLLQCVLTENHLTNKPGHIFNVDETGLQLNNRPGHVLAEKGSKNVPVITSGEKGETISVISCCNAEGVFLPPYSIFKGKNRKEEYADGMPPGSLFEMSEKSGYVNAAIFLHWLERLFIPRKPQGKVILILDGHTSHTASIELLECAEINEILMLCLPSHTTHFLQPLDRSFFKSLKGHFYSECDRFMRNHPTRKITRYQFGGLLGNAWNFSATVKNATSGFIATGIMPFNPNKIPDYAFVHTHNLSSQTDEHMQVKQLELTDALEQPGSSRTNTAIFNENNGAENIQAELSNVASTSTAEESSITPGKLLTELSPVPITPAVETVKSRGRRIAEVLNSAEKIEAKKASKRGKKKQQITKPKKRKNGNREISESSDDDLDIPVTNDSEDEEEWNENECIGCGEDYRQTNKTEDWIQCVICNRWCHENCTKYVNLCDTCGNVTAKKK